MSGARWADVLTIVGLIGFFGSLLAVGVVIVMLPARHFAETLSERREQRREHWLRFLLRNLLGAAVLVAGVVLLFIPGQGLLAILIGLLLMDFPGKRRCITAIIERPHVLAAANRLRSKFGKPPFETPHAARPAD